MMVCGIGNAHRGDDGAGLVAAERLRGRLPPSVRVRALGGDLTELLDAWAGEEAVVVIDAMASGGPPGSVRRFEGSVPSKALRTSTHAFGVGEAIELARALGRLPARIVVFAIEGRSFGAGEPLSPEVDAAVGVVVARVLEESCTSTR